MKKCIRNIISFILVSILLIVNMCSSVAYANGPGGETLIIEQEEGEHGDIEYSYEDGGPEYDEVIGAGVEDISMTTGDITVENDGSAVGIDLVEGGIQSEELYITSVSGTARGIRNQSGGSAITGNLYVAGYDDTTGVAADYTMLDLNVHTGDIYVNSESEESGIAKGVEISTSEKGTPNVVISTGTIDVEANTGSASGIMLETKDKDHVKVFVDGDISTSCAETEEIEDYTAGIHLGEVGIGKNTTIISTGDVFGSHMAVYGEDEDTLLESLDKIYVHALDSNSHLLIADGSLFGEYEETINMFPRDTEDYENAMKEIYAAEDKYLQKINYIIKDESESKIGYFTLSSATGKAGSVTGLDGVEYQTAKESDSETSDIKVNVATVDGYTFKSFAGDSAAFIKANEDGSYTLIVPRGGGVSLKLVYEAIKQEEEKHIPISSNNKSDTRAENVSKLKSYSDENKESLEKLMGPNLITGEEESGRLSLLNNNAEICMLSDDGYVTKAFGNVIMGIGYIDDILASGKTDGSVDKKQCSISAPLSNKEYKQLLAQGKPLTMKLAGQEIEISKDALLDNDKMLSVSINPSPAGYTYITVSNILPGAEITINGKSTKEYNKESYVGNDGKRYYVFWQEKQIEENS